ncbi:MULTISPECIES: hypothetical protein [unclassified Acinetobacter]|uniref:hypothetical protein n=1 Tax=unclassified Acinetobacter TaxID=196816 RepID=UPI0025B8E67A|nr:MULTISPECIES: hypothetical protein [unclassified Acinetobacter]
MSIEKLNEFAKNVDSSGSNTEGLNLDNGFPSRLQPARQWFNWLFNNLTKKVNEIIDALGSQYNDLNQKITNVDNKFPNKLDKEATAVAAKKLETARQIQLTGDASGSANFDGTTNINIQAKLEKGFGINQTRINLTGQRVSGQEYTNVTGSPIEVNITIIVKDTQPYAQLIVDGEPILQAYCDVGANGRVLACFTATILNGSTYKLFQDNGIISWYEIR